MQLFATKYKVITHKCCIIGSIFAKYGQIFTFITKQIISYSKLNQSFLDVKFLLCNQFARLLIFFFVFNPTLSKTQ